ncbi:dienelactone hydrolase family protein [Bradyrhizobium sp. SYSU BS000235]|uniref:dienelactone hydrolase family protein n=1 Tax=Bradyrhizobium sp. SYSU BS000235 TaxID=3411332 RepID=UPI003C7184D3
MRARTTAIVCLMIGCLAANFGTTALADDRTPDAAKPDTVKPDVLWPTAAIMRGATVAPDLTFPDKAQTGAAGLERRMTLMKPEGDGPFPAIVMVHQCAGLNGAVMANAREAVAQNYVVLMIDSLTPRGVTTVCYGPKNGVNFFRGVRDALQAAEHLRNQPYVDKARIALVGFSWGAMVGLMTASQHYASAALVNATPFAAVVSFYPGCFKITPPNGRPPFETLNPDIKRPLLVLMGEDDTETPSGECVSKLEAAKRAGATVEWHVYPKTTHCWDCRGLDGRSKTDVRGHHVEYRFSPEATKDGRQRMFEFLKRTMAKG